MDFLYDCHSPYLTTSSFPRYASYQNALAGSRSNLFLSIVNVTFTGLAQTPAVYEISPDLVTGLEDVTEASERGHTQSEELPEWLGRPTADRRASEGYLRWSLES